MERKEETAAVKKALIQRGFGKNNIKVTHGKGTAWGWLKVYGKIHHNLDCDCIEYDPVSAQPQRLSQGCRELWRECYEEIIKIAQTVIGRTGGEYDGRIGVSLDFFTK